MVFFLLLLGIEMSMFYINYNYLYYFWYVYKEGFVVGVVEVFYLIL